MSNEICVFEWRYGSREMRELFSRKNILRTMAEVEVALLYGLAKVGICTENEAKKVEQIIDKIDVEQVNELEKKLGHDVMALTVHLAELSGAKYIHYGATSYDIIDTAYAILFSKALKLTKQKLKTILELLISYSLNYKDLVMIGRTHGQHALPITLGFKLANYAYEFSRSYERLCELEKRLVRIKMAGAVGTMAAWQDKGLEIEKYTSEKLNIPPHVISTQVAPRDGFAELVSDLAILGSQLDRLALEIRELMRPEILELAEGEAVERVGSSTMPHKENPVTAEKISGLAKVLRGFVITELENIPLWHERDLTNSSSERIVISHSLLTIDEMLDSTIRLLKTLKIFPENMEKNLNLTRGLIMAESLMVNLTLKGMPRHKAHELSMAIAREAEAKNKAFYDMAVENNIVKQYFNTEELKDILNPGKYLGSYSQLIERTKDYVTKVISSCV
ncbi:adenylosuccinate lyase [Stygiolobus caldivivus]|uniref:Adenylosuccinate lyase n=1 Tax=Stygiolobus caldivivus TaxID=2824673 RepID=A0A8D5U7V4_9CREN|nr:adenylosuccinate lyase [Stygiolobus caldivivus]BCU70553.1 adenylosuccinate lyase [Stygiolobus caldivivus]